MLQTYFFFFFCSFHLHFVHFRVRKMIPMQSHQIPEVSFLSCCLNCELVVHILSISCEQELILFALRTKLGIPQSRFNAMTGGRHLKDVCSQEALHGDLLRSS